MLTTTVRGNAVVFTATPVDATGAPTTPQAVAIYLAYGQGAVRKAEVAMTLTGGVWTGTWDSEGAPAGVVYWSVRASNPDAAEDGEFTLTANPANPGL
jgi:hypothetical protein